MVANLEVLNFFFIRNGFFFSYVEYKDRSFLIIAPFETRRSFAKIPRFRHFEARVVCSVDNTWQIKSSFYLLSSCWSCIVTLSVVTSISLFNLNSHSAPTNRPNQLRSVSRVEYRPSKNTFVCRLFVVVSRRQSSEIFERKAFCLFQMLAILIKI